MRQGQIAVAIMAFSAAGALLLLRGDGAEPLPDTPESRTRWKCHACTHPFSLTAAEAHAAAERAGAWSPLGCPVCGKEEAYRVATCPVCGSLYFGSDVPGETGACPRCARRPEGGALGNRVSPMGPGGGGGTDEPPPAQERPPPVM